MITTQMSQKELVVLIHGFGAKRAVMWPLAVRLRSNGYGVRLWSYVTLFRSINYHAERLHDYLMTQLAEESRFSIVAHSMGAIVARVVPAAKTILESVHKYETVNGPHNSLLMSKKVRGMITSFLRSGDFGREEC